VVWWHSRRHLDGEESLNTFGIDVDPDRERIVDSTQLVIEGRQLVGHTCLA
jgi:hypothetical protein